MVNADDLYDLLAEKLRWLMYECGDAIKEL